MSYSSYQMQRLLERLRILSEWLNGPVYRRWRGEDPVRVSRAGRQSAQAAGSGGPPASSAAAPGLAAVRDPRRLQPLVEEERERRAGSFMQPPYPDEPPPAHIPKAGPRPARRRRPRPVGEGD
jgi:hypothetical protein